MYQLPLLRSEVPTSTKLEESKGLGPENADGESSEAEWVAQDVDASTNGPSAAEQAEELQRLHSQFEQIRQSLLHRSVKLLKSYHPKPPAGEPMAECKEKDETSSAGDFDLVEPVQDARMIAFYNNQGSKSNLLSWTSQPQSYLQGLLINTKFKIDS